MPRKNSLKNKKTIHGIHIDKYNTAQTLDELYGDKESNPFGTIDEKEFEDKLTGMDLMDMEMLATKVELRPVHDRRLMKERLIKKFNEKRAKILNAGVAEQLAGKNKPLSKTREKIINDILKEGR